MKEYQSTINVLILAVGAVVAAAVFRGGPATKTAAVNPAPDTRAAERAEFTKLLREGIGENKSGTRDEFAAGILAGLADKIPSQATGRQLSLLVTALGKVGGKGDGPLNLEPTLRKCGLAEIAPGPLADEAKAAIAAKLYFAADTAEAL